MERRNIETEDFVVAYLWNVGTIPRGDSKDSRKTISPRLSLALHLMSDEQQTYRARLLLDAIEFNVAILDAILKSCGVGWLVYWETELEEIKLICSDSEALSQFSRRLHSGNEEQSQEWITALREKSQSEGNPLWHCVMAKSEGVFTHLFAKREALKEIPKRRLELWEQKEKARLVAGLAAKLALHESLFSKFVLYTDKTVGDAHKRCVEIKKEPSEVLARWIKGSKALTQRLVECEKLAKKWDQERQGELKREPRSISLARSIVLCSAMHRVLPENVQVVAELKNKDTGDWEDKIFQTCTFVEMRIEPFSRSLAGVKDEDFWKGDGTLPLGGLNYTTHEQRERWGAIINARGAHSNAKQFSYLDFRHYLKWTVNEVTAHGDAKFTLDFECRDLPWDQDFRVKEIRLLAKSKEVLAAISWQKRQYTSSSTHGQVCATFRVVPLIDSSV
jgi:hypothetical protein